MSPQHGHAAGCNITKEDTPIVIGSITCAFAYAMYGACYSALSAALPSLADSLGMSTSDFGIAYSARGIGYLVGTLISAYVLNLPTFNLSKPFLTCTSLVISGLTMIFIALVAKNFTIMLILFTIQGIGFGGVDMMANCAVPEMWGLRAQPWMQAMHTGFGVAAIVGPALVGALGYKTSFLIISFLCLLPVGLLVLGCISEAQHNRKNRQKSHSLNNHNSGTGKADGLDDSIHSNTENNVLNALIKHTHIEDGQTAGAGNSHNSKNSTNNKNIHNKHNSNYPENSTLSHRSNASIRSENLHSYRGRTRTLSQTYITNGPMSLSLNLTTDPEPEPDPEECAEEKKVWLIPPSIKYLTCVFYFLYMGFAAGYSSWITTYALNVGITDSESKAAYLISIYWATMTSGRLLAIFISVHYSATQMIRLKLLQCVVSAVVLVCVADTNYLNLCIATAMFGYAESSLFPLAMTVVTDYGFTMDSSATTLFMVGTTVGDSVLPVLIGFLMQIFGDSAFIYTMAACCAGLVVIYLTVHMLGSDKRYFDDKYAVKWPLKTSTENNENTGINPSAAVASNGDEDSNVKF